MIVPVALGIIVSASIMQAMADVIGSLPGGDGDARRLASVSAMRRRLGEIVLSDKATTSAIIEILPDGIDLVDNGDASLCWGWLYAADSKILTALSGLRCPKADTWADSVRGTEGYVESVLHSDACPDGRVCMCCGAVYDDLPDRCSTCGAGSSRIILWGDV